MADDNRVQFRASEDLVRWLNGRGRRFSTGDITLNGRAQQELRLWREALRVEQARPRWTVEQLWFLAQLVRGVIPGEWFGSVLAQDVTDAIGEGEVAPELGAEVQQKVLSVGPVADHATIDGLVRFWSEAAESDPLDPDTWRGLGFRVTVPGSDE